MGSSVTVVENVNFLTLCEICRIQACYCLSVILILLVFLLIFVEVCFLAMLFGFCSFLFVPARLVLMVHYIAHIIVCPERLVALHSIHLYQFFMVIYLFSLCFLK